MKFFHAFLYIFIISFLFTFIITTPSYEDYTAAFLDTIRIGSQSKQISLILNTLSSKTVLFTNSKRPYAQQIQRGRKSDILIDKVSLEGEKIDSFPFNLEIDDTQLNNANIQGEFGLGIDKENTCDLVDILHDNKIIASKVIGFELQEEEGDKEDKFVLDLEPKVSDYTFCELTSKKFLSSDDFYNEAWISDISHIVIGSTKKDLVWNNTIEVSSKVAFDSRTKHVYIPKDYMKYITNLWNINSIDCKIVHDKESDEQYFKCDKSAKSKILDMPSIYFVIDGYAFRLEAPDLFEIQIDKKYINCLIRFYDHNDNLWILGVPFLREYKTVFDYDEGRIGFKGGHVVNFKEEYEKWQKEVEEKEKEEEESSFFKNGFYSWEKIIMIIGAIIGTLIILYVMYWLYRNCRRETSKYHIELNEQYDKKEFYH